MGSSETALSLFLALVSSAGHAAGALVRSIIRRLAQASVCTLQHTTLGKGVLRLLVHHTTLRLYISIHSGWMLIRLDLQNTNRIPELGEGSQPW